MQAPSGQLSGPQAGPVVVVGAASEVPSVAVPSVASVGASVVGSVRVREVPEGAVAAVSAGRPSSPQAAAMAKRRIPGEVARFIAGDGSTPTR